MKTELEKRLIPTEEKGFFKDPLTGALVSKQPLREKKIDEMIKKVPELEKKVDEINNKLDLILSAIKG